MMSEAGFVGRPFVTVDKLYFLRKTIKESRNVLQGTIHETKLKHWEELLGMLMFDGGDLIIPKLKKVIYKDGVGVDIDAHLAFLLNIDQMPDQLTEKIKAEVWRV